jgi:hypothetical protein
MKIIRTIIGLLCMAICAMQAFGQNAPAGPYTSTTDNTPHLGAAQQICGVQTGPGGSLIVCDLPTATGGAPPYTDASAVDWLKQHGWECYADEMIGATCWKRPVGDPWLRPWGSAPLPDSSMCCALPSDPRVQAQIDALKRKIDLLPPWSELDEHGSALDDLFGKLAKQEAQIDALKKDVDALKAALKKDVDALKAAPKNTGICAGEYFKTHPCPPDETDWDAWCPKDKKGVRNGCSADAIRNSITGCTDCGNAPKKGAAKP